MAKTRCPMSIKSAVSSPLCRQKRFLTSHASQRARLLKSCQRHYACFFYYVCIKCTIKLPRSLLLRIFFFGIRVLIFHRQRRNNTTLYEPGPLLLRYDVALRQARNFLARSSGLFVRGVVYGRHFLLLLTRSLVAK